MIVKSKTELCKLLGITINRMNNLVHTYNMPKIKNLGSTRLPQFVLTSEYRTIVESYNSKVVTYGKSSSVYKHEGPSGASWALATEKRVREMV
jgi:hypothetical protein